VVTILTCYQANPKLAKLRDDDDRLPIHWAASYNRLPLVEILSDRKDFDPDVQVRHTSPAHISNLRASGKAVLTRANHQDGAGWTPLMIASSLKDTSTSDPLISLLLAKNADPTLTTSTGATALHFAASKSNLDTAKKLLEHKASARVKDKRGQLPLHRAAAVGNVPMVKLLLQNRSPVNASDGDGCTALHHAVAEGHGDAAVVLLKAGAETDKKDNNGALALDLAPDAKVSQAAICLIVERVVTDFVVGQRFYQEGCRGGGNYPVDWVYRSAQHRLESALSSTGMNSEMVVKHDIMHLLEFLPFNQPNQHHHFMFLSTSSRYIFLTSTRSLFNSSTSSSFSPNICRQASYLCFTRFNS
jgi:26S proteasome non-ATPase regulatory subunit 10